MGRYTAVAVSAAACFVDGANNVWGPGKTHPKAAGLYRVGVFGAGLLGELFTNWSPNVTYGLMTAGLVLTADRIPGAIADKNASEVVTYAVSGDGVRVSAANGATGLPYGVSGDGVRVSAANGATGLPYGVSGDGVRVSAANGATGLPFYGDSPGVVDQSEHTTTVAGYHAGCTSCASGRLAHALIAPTTSAGYEF